MVRNLWLRFAGIVLINGAIAMDSFAQLPPAPADAPRSKPPTTLPPPMIEKPHLVESILTGQSLPIDLPTALRLAGASNPELQLARERVSEAVAIHQLAAAQFLPTINTGTNYDLHRGNLQQSTGNILSVHRDALYLGLGANAVGAGTVNIPGIYYNVNLSETIVSALATKQIVAQRQFASDAARNDILLRVANAYLMLLRADERRAIAMRNRDEIREVARVTAEFALARQGRPADAERAAAELEMRNAEFLDAENEILTASARLCQLLSLDPSIRLQSAESHVVPAPIVPDPIPLQQLLAIAIAQRPELRERQAAIREAMLTLRGAKLLPFSPQAILGYSAGSFGGGSNLVPNRFGNFDGRQDLDIILYWELRNLGVGNVALVRRANSEKRSSELRELIVLDRIGAEVARARARTQTRFAQIETNERATQASQHAFQQDLERTRNREGLPIEVLDSLRLLSRSRYQYLDAIIDFNLAQFELYVALGQPPADFLARPVTSMDLPAVPADPKK